MVISLSIRPEHETNRIVNFLKRTKRKTRIEKIVVGMSGGIDSTTVFYLLKEAYPAENIYPAILNFYPKDNNPTKKILADSGIPKNNILDISIKPMVDEIEKRLQVDSDIRKGNLMARVRMITLFDLAKKIGGMVSGTENKTERLLGYYTRFGDAASDIEPISHLYKTQVYELAKYLGVPTKIMKAAPTAGLWAGQTDEKEFGFTYREADQVLHLHYDRKMKSEKILKMGFKHARSIIERSNANKFKLLSPYKIRNHT
jgi:NAD+ synthase